ncbi:MAG: hypothetical protein ACOYX5_09355 [Actinomycetota bacterium]
MQWDLGLQGLVVLGGMSLGFGVVAGILVNGARARRLWALLITTVVCFGLGLLTSEGLFGWADEEELQPNIDGLSRDEVLLSSVLATATVVLVMRYLARRSRDRSGRGTARVAGPRHGPA